MICDEVFRGGLAGRTMVKPMVKPKELGLLGRKVKQE